MPSKNLLEATLGITFTASQHWDRHPLVGLSALFFGFPASAFLAVWICIFRFVPRPFSAETLVHVVFYLVLFFQYVGAIITCASADYIFLKRGHRSAYGRIDIVWAGIVFFTSIFDFGLRASVLETAALTMTAVAAFGFSGSSKTTKQWVFRHSLWHAVAGGIGTYGALRHAPEGDTIKEWIRSYAMGITGTYVVGACVCLELYFILYPASSRRALWERGAQYANWRPVVPDR
eukprot:TRINITY_DN65251_c0_g1_i1.p1 TRINITY_DN65251_c0_g1~~TRINITY_DN65251_c0_g1_i1.p1  ORF type:complete len:254 (-),score=17.47 TRINITY_DN65251_c0_g1_i1:132-830(-)